MLRALRLLWNVTRAFSAKGLLGGAVLGGLLPLVFVPLQLFGLLFGYPANFGVVLAIMVFGALTGAALGLATGVVAGLLSSALTLLFFARRAGTPAHHNLIRALTILPASALTFGGVFLLFGSTDMSPSSVLIWRLPAAIVAAGYGWWLSGKLAKDECLWSPEAVACNEHWDHDFA